MRQFIFPVAVLIAISFNQPVFAGTAQNLSPKHASNFSKGGGKKGKSKKQKKSSEGSGKAAGVRSDANSSPATDVKKNVENPDNPFQTKKKSWSVGPHIGFPFIQGDIPSNMGLAGGLFIQKALGYSVALRLNYMMGTATGISTQRMANGELYQNNGMNGIGSTKTNYAHAGSDAFLNYKDNFKRVTLDVVYNINNLNFMKEDPKFSLYVMAGAGGFFYNTLEDQLDANGKMYDYSKDKINGKTSAEIKSQLKAMRDGTYESPNDYTTSNKKIAGMYMTPAFNAGIGAQYKLNDRLNLFAEAAYTFTGSDFLDGDRWYNPGVPTAQPDALFYFSLGVNIRLGKTDKVYWFSNPLSMPYKSILESKQKLAKVDKLEKDVESMKGRVDTLRADVDSLKVDADHDGVSDYFDKEDNTPNGAIVNGAGQTIFYKDDDGNLVFVDPNAADDSDEVANPDAIVDENGNPVSDGGLNGASRSANGTGRSGSGAARSTNANGKGASHSGAKAGKRTNANGNGNGGGDNDKEGNWDDDNVMNNGGDNNGTFYDGTNAGKKKMKDAGKVLKMNGAGQVKTAFNPKKKNGRTIVANTNNNMAAGNSKGGNNSSYYNSQNMPGTNSAIGYLPAVFFETASARISTSSYPQLYEVARVLRSNPQAKVHVIGYTDYRSSAAANQKLGMRRAEAVANALKNYFGVPAEQLEIDSKGEVEPLTNLKSMPALAANRRVQFEVNGEAVVKTTTKTGATGTRAGAKSTAAPKKAAVQEQPKTEEENIAAPVEETKPADEAKPVEEASPAPVTKPAPVAKPAAVKKTTAPKPAMKKAAPVAKPAKPAKTEAPKQEEKKQNDLDNDVDKLLNGNTNTDTATKAAPAPQETTQPAKQDEPQIKAEPQKQPADSSKKSNDVFTPDNDF